MTTTVPRTMVAAMQDGYGSENELELREVELPRISAEQVLLRVRASSINPVEWYRVMGPIFARVNDGLLKPKQSAIGVDVAGCVEAVGEAVTGLAPGDEVFGTSGASWAEYAPAREVRLVRKPANISFEEAAAVPVAGLTALQALRDHGRVQPGQKVLVNGASGGVGTFAVQLAKSFGADVTAVCSTRNVEQAAELGADRVCDYTREDFTRLGVRHDLMLDIAGSRSLRAVTRVLTPEANVVVVGGRMSRGLGPLPHVASMWLGARVRRRPMKFFVSKITQEDLAVLADLLETGKLRSVIDRTYPLTELHEALRYFGEGHARGKVVLSTVTTR